MQSSGEHWERDTKKNIQTFKTVVSIRGMLKSVTGNRKKYGGLNR